MSELSPAARAFLEAHRHDGEPGLADASRVRAALELSLGTTAAATAAAPWFAKLTLVKGVVLVATTFSVAWVTLGTIRAFRSETKPVVERGLAATPPPRVEEAAPEPQALPSDEPQQPPSQQPPSQPPSQQPPSQQPQQAPPSLQGPPAVPVEHQEPPPPPAVEPAPEPEAAPPVEVIGPPSAPAAPAEDEVRLVTEAQEHLRHGDPSEALNVLARWEAAFAHSGQLAQEARAARIVALCLSGQRGAGRAETTAFLAEFPSTLHRNRIERACR